MSDHSVMIWGAGRIGRGFAGDLFQAAGYRLVFVDQNATLIQRLRERGRYSVVSAPNANERTARVVDGYVALATSETAEIAEALCAVDYLVICVFPQSFSATCRVLAAGLADRKRRRPAAALDIILCANLAHAGERFRADLLAGLAPELQTYALDRIGVVESLVMRMVADPPADALAADPLIIWTNGFAEFPVDGDAFRGFIPAIPSMRRVTAMRAEETRKLYTYNMCHAVIAYHGALRGHTGVVEALADPIVFAEAEGALRESSRALELGYGFAAEDMARWATRVLQQTDNASLNDTIARHGADPGRKLRRSDRLVGPALLAQQHGITPHHLTRAIAAGLLFAGPRDSGAARVQAMIAALGIEAATRELCELTDADAALLAAIVDAHKELAERRNENGAVVNRQAPR
jgi:mannitol-1-phosphate 5-dehydrogenase